MNFIRKLVNSLRRSRLSSAIELRQDYSGREFDSVPLRLSIYYANGGVVVETKVYDEYKDRHKTSLYIIHEDQDLGEEMSKIITYNNLGN